jgi:hypothetical protein
LALISVLSVAGVTQSAQILPRIEGTALNDRKVALPDAAHYRAMVLIFGFSHKAADQTEAWGKRVGTDFGSNSTVAYFIIPELEGVPGMVKPMILHGMRHEVPADENAHFMPIYELETDLKKLVNYGQPESAYVVVATSDGRVTWQTAGAATDDRYSAMKQALNSLLSK